MYKNLKTTVVITKTNRLGNSHESPSLYNGKDSTKFVTNHNFIPNELFNTSTNGIKTDKLAVNR